MPAHQSRRRERGGVNVLDALGLASRARRVQPERNVVGQRRRRKQVAATARQERAEIMHVTASPGEGGAIVGAAAD